MLSTRWRAFALKENLQITYVIEYSNKTDSMEEKKYQTRLNLIAK